jgi:hypothetical protein
LSAELFSSVNVAGSGGAEVPKKEAEVLVAGDDEAEIAGALEWVRGYEALAFGKETRRSVNGWRNADHLRIRRWKKMAMER